MGKEYDVALSFAGEDRIYVKEVAEILRDSGIKVFYDEFEEANLWGKDLYTYLKEIYRDQSRYTIMFCSVNYAKKLWTNHERESAQERAFKENFEYILPARFDDTEIPGLSKTIAYISLKDKSPYEFCLIIGKKLKVKIQKKDKVRQTLNETAKKNLEENSLTVPEFKNRNKNWNNYQMFMESIDDGTRLAIHMKIGLNILENCGLSIKALKEYQTALSYNKGEIDNEFIIDLAKSIERLQRRKRYKMDEKDRIETDDINEEARWEDVELLLSQVTPDIEERDMLDAFLLVKAAGIPTNPVDKRIDLWGQALYIASSSEPKPKEFEQWMNNAIYLAWQQLLNRLKQLNLDPDLVNEPLKTIVEVYGYSSALYNKHKCEAFRISQLYYYYSLLNIDKATEEEIDNAGAYTVGLVMLVVGFAYSDGCYQESITLAGSIFEVIGQMDIKRWTELQPEDICRDLENTLYMVCYNASKSAREIRKFSEALDWLRRAEPYVSSLEKAHMRSSYHVKRGEVLIELGKAEEALTWFESAVKIADLTPQEVKDAKRQLEYAKYKIIGESGILFDSMLADLSKAEDIETLKQIIESATTGNLKPDEISKMVGMIERALGLDSLKLLAQNTALEKLPLELAKYKRQLIVLFARSAMQSGNFSKVEKLIPEIEQLAESDSPAQLDAAFFLVRFRQYQGEPVTWESLSPLVSRLFQLPKTLILNNLLDLSSILVQLENQDLRKASSTIADLLKEITFDSEDERTPTAVVQQTAFSMDIIDSFLTLLVAMAESVHNDPGWWLKSISRFKYLSSYRGQRLQKESKLFRFALELPEDSRRIEKLVESLTRNSFDTKGKGNAERETKEVELMTLLYPLYSSLRPSQKDKYPDTLYPEIIHIETATFFQMEDRESPVINVAYGDGNWGAYVPGVEIDKSFVPRYLYLLETSGAVGLEDEVMIEIGLKLRKALLPIPQHKGLFSLTGVRSTGVYHKIPIDSLPLLVDEETGKVAHWVGEQITSVLLTGLNKDLAVLEKPLSMDNITIFANSTFKYPLKSLPGVVKEIGAIEEAFKTTTDVSRELHRESDSNRQTFLRLSGKNAPQVLHIATHGIISEESPSASFIALSDKNSAGNVILGAVGYYDIMLMDLRQCDLVVLSACSTHEGKSIIGEGIMGLAWAFKAAGAKAVIGTRWPVNDAAAAAFWRKFYENICSGCPIGEAFQGARMHIMKQEKWNHPYYWGVFQLIV